MILGIDLGTTNSLVGVFTEEGTKLLPNALGALLTPSVVSVTDDGAVLVGQAAKERLVTAPGRTVATFKRWMGSNRVTKLGKHEFRPEELSALVLRALVSDAEAALGVKVEEAVISVPAYFGDAQRKATRAAGQLAGLKVERLINEPTAAALAYGLEQRKEGGRFLVFDLGGGTFDVSILEMFDGVMEVHATAGDNFLGGEDFLSVMRAACLRDLQLDERALKPGEDARLRRRLEDLKRLVAQLPAQTHTVEIPLECGARQWSLNEERFAALCEPLVQRLRQPLERAMRDARLTPEKLDEVVLVGGASRMPLCARLVSRMFGRLPLRHVSPDEAIAVGASVAAGLKARAQKLEEVVLTDVCPHSLGVEVSELLTPGSARSGIFDPIIERNSTVPVSRVHRYFPLHDSQRHVEFEVFQGESPRVENNVRLGSLRVDVPQRARHENAIDVRFTYDINGLLEVEALVVATGQRREVVLEQNPGLLSPEEIRTRLAALAELKVHPREQHENLALIARAERLYEELIVHRPQLQDALLWFRALLDRQDLRAIRDARSKLQSLLDALEGLG